MFAHSHSIKDHPGQLAGAAGIAAAIGAAGAMLFTPRRGSEVRHGIRVRGKIMKDKMAHMKHAEKKAAENAGARTKTVAQSASNRAKSTASKIKEDTKATAHEAKETAQQTKGDTKDIADEIRRRGEP